MNKLTKWWDRRRRARALRKINKLRRLAEPIGVIRQFLYLDAVALRSLYVSRYGPEDARITITNSRTRDAEMNGSFGHAVPGVGTANAGAHLRSSIADSTQIERISSEQSLFRDFLERESIAGPHSKLWDGTPDPKGVLSPASGALKRGDLIQVRVRLRADITYRISSFASALANLAESTPELQVSGTSDMLQVAGVLRQLLIEQAPIDAELTDWGWGATTESLVPTNENPTPVRLVALTQIDNYWIDVRRALFDEAECTALVRVSEDAPSSKWSPLKLFDAVRGIPGLEALDETIRHATESFGESVTESSSSESPLAISLACYAERLSPSGVPEFVLTQVARIATHYSTPPQSATSTSEAFDEVDQLLALAGVAAKDPDEVGEIRSELLALAKSSSTDNASAQNSHMPESSGVQHIVGEVIALYW